MFTFYYMLFDLQQYIAASIHVLCPLPWVRARHPLIHAIDARHGLLELIGEVADTKPNQLELMEVYSLLAQDARMLLQQLLQLPLHLRQLPLQCQHALRQSKNSLVLERHRMLLRHHMPGRWECDIER